MDIWQCLLLFAFLCIIILPCTPRYHKGSLPMSFSVRIYYKRNFSKPLNPNISQRATFFTRSRIQLSSPTPVREHAITGCMLLLTKTYSSPGTIPGGPKDHLRRRYCTSTTVFKNVLKCSCYSSLREKTSLHAKLGRRQIAVQDRAGSVATSHWETWRYWQFAGHDMWRTRQRSSRNPSQASVCLNALRASVSDILTRWLVLTAEALHSTPHAVPRNISLQT